MLGLSSLQESTPGIPAYVAKQRQILSAAVLIRALIFIGTQPSSCAISVSPSAACLSLIHPPVLESMSRALILSS